MGDECITTSEPNCYLTFPRPCVLLRPWWCLSAVRSLVDVSTGVVRSLGFKTADQIYSPSFSFIPQPFTFENFIEEFYNPAIRIHGNFLLLADFNVDVSGDSKSVKFLNEFSETYLNQLLQMPTRSSGHT